MIGLRARRAFVSSLAIGAALLSACGDDTTAKSADMSAATGDLSAASAGCMLYCSTMTKACSGSADAGSLSQYQDESACIHYCNGNGDWPAGTTGAASGNTLACRGTHAEAALGNPAAECANAGPSGNNTCGTWCENYCQLMEKNCVGANAIYDATTCMQKCATMPSNGLPGDVDGDTVQCRIYHMGVAFDDPVTHCPHGRTLADNPDGPCQNSP
jgi:hypothetical protein